MDKNKITIEEDDGVELLTIPLEHELNTVSFYQNGQQLFIGTLPSGNIQIGIKKSKECSDEGQSNEN